MRYIWMGKTSLQHLSTVYQKSAGMSRTPGNSMVSRGSGSFYWQISKSSWTVRSPWPIPGTPLGSLRACSCFRLRRPSPGCVTVSRSISLAGLLLPHSSELTSVSRNLYPWRKALRQKYSSHVVSLSHAGWHDPYIQRTFPGKRYQAFLYASHPPSIHLYWSGTLWYCSVFRVLHHSIPEAHGWTASTGYYWPVLMCSSPAYLSWTGSRLASSFRSDRRRIGWLFLSASCLPSYHPAVPVCIGRFCNSSICGRILFVTSEMKPYDASNP